MREFSLIRDLTYEYNADIGFEYSSPCRGVWNIVHIGTQVPQSHQIYVCPTSCLRGVVLTTAEMGCMDRLSTITVGEDNILEGNMEETLQEGTEKIIDSLPERPKVIMIFISCIHHFLAADYQRVYGILRKEYPDIDFVDAYMDPIMRRKTPPVPSLERQIYRVLKPAEHRSHQVNIIGNWFVSSYSDMMDHLRNHGIDVRDLAEETDYEHFKKQQESSLNLTFHKHAAWAGRDLELRLHQKWMEVDPSYEYERIDADMKRVSEYLGIPAPSDSEIQAKRNMVEQRVKSVQNLYGDTPVSIDYTAVDQPLGLALFLMNHGFQVESVFLENFTEREEVFDALQQKKPDLKVYSSTNWNMRMMDRNHPGKIVGIGQKAAYYNNTPYFIDIIQSAGMYGYKGILHLMDLLEEAYRNEKDLRTLIQHKGWRCYAK